MAANSVDPGDEKPISARNPVSTRDLDTAAAFTTSKKGILNPAEALRIRKKIDKHIMPLMCILYLCVVTFVELRLHQPPLTEQLGYNTWTSRRSGMLLLWASGRESAHLTTNEYNWLGTIFYLSYLAFEFPQSLCLQRFPVAKWMLFNISLWAVALCAHAAWSITAGFMIVTSMFYTRNEQTVRVGYWFLMNGVAQIISGFVAFGTLHIRTGSFEAWQWQAPSLKTPFGESMMFLFPDSSTNACFLTPEERATAVQRLKENQTGVENKHFKKEQLIEALTDPKTWLFALFAALENVPNSLSNQRQIIVSSFGFTRLQTTLLGCVNGLIEIVTIWTGVTIASRIPNSRAYVSFAYKIPMILALCLINFLPWRYKIGLLFAQWVTGIGTTAFVLSLSWISSVTDGHTKRVTVNAITLSAYCIGNAAGPFMWKAKYQPRDHVPWIVIRICNTSCMALLLMVRFLLSTENGRRDREPPDETYENIYIERVGKSGVTELVKVDKEFLDLTDIQNRDFRYVL
ncbi:unnamed protein product [Cyclocybe aegerita]|uniref:MFS general substrate transporter n=1 Tax=Cyclocybe aegerita TaxID=1973307 RepID=A0A8S0VUL2_CYCAE|nr:unnamed protein product [Cyclocybe aegerita]